jgi:hypothetical protein
MFDILIVIGLGIISVSGINIAYQSHRQYKKTEIFAKRHLEIMHNNTQAMKNISNDLKDIRSGFKKDIDKIEFPSIPCIRYKNKECDICGGTGVCVFNNMNTFDGYSNKANSESADSERIDSERMATKPQKVKVMEK